MLNLTKMAAWEMLLQERRRARPDEVAIKYLERILEGLERAEVGYRELCLHLAMSGYAHGDAAATYLKPISGAFPDPPAA